MKGTPRHLYWLVGVIVVLLAFIIGCGGSGGGSGSGTAAPTGNQAVRSTSLATYQSLGAGVSIPFAALLATAPTGSTLHAAAILAGKTRGIQFVPALGLYTTGFQTTSTGGQFLYYADSSASTSAGSMKITSSSGSFTYTTFPVNISIQVNIMSGNMPCQGSMQIVFDGATGNNSMTGSLTLTKNQEVVTINMALSSTLVATGSMTVTENGTTIQTSTLNGPVTGDLAFSFTTTPQNYSGTGTLNLVNTTLSLTFTNPADASCSLDGSGDLVIKYPNGSTETVNDPFPAALLGGTTGTTATTAGATAGTTAGTTAGATGTTAPPYTIAAVPGNPAGILGASPDGRMVGFVTASTEAPAYWASPSSSPQAITVDPALTKTNVLSVNSSGHMLGTAIDSTGAVVFLHWSAFNQSPTRIVTPPNIVGNGNTNMFLQSTDQFVVSVLTNSFTNVSYVYKSSTDTNPFQLAGGYVTGVSDGNAAIGVSSSGSMILWTSLKATTSPIPIPAANTPSLKNALIGSDGTIVVNDSGAQTVTVVTAPNYTSQTQLLEPTVKGSIGATGVGQKGHVLGTTMIDSTGLDNDGLIWMSPTSVPINLRSSATPNIIEGLYETPTGVLVVLSNSSAAPRYFYMTPK